MKMKQQRNANEGRKLIERNKHLNLHKQTKQKDENDYKPISASKEKEIINKKVHLNLTQVFTSVCQHLQGFTRVYRGLQGYAGVYRGLQGSTVYISKLTHMGIIGIIMG